MISTIAATMMMGMAQGPPPPASAPIAPPAVLPAPAPPPTDAPARRHATLADLVTSADYPDAARRHNEQGTVGFTLDVSPDGRVTNCTVTASSGSASLDTATCRIMKSRARFTPSRDSAGEPVTDTVAARIVWRIESPLDLPFEPLSLIAEMRADAAGAMTCWSGNNQEPLTERPCPSGPKGPMSNQLPIDARDRGKAMSMSFVTTLTPQADGEGAAPPAEPASRGDLFHAADAMLRIARDGSILECRILRNEWVGGAGGGAPPSPCVDWYPGLGLYQRAAKGTPVRIAGLTVRAYATH